MDIQKLIDDYASWLKRNIHFEKFGEYYEITTPYLDNANDYLQLYVKQEGNNIFFTDDGATINGLKMNGLNITGNRRKHLEQIVNRYGLSIRGNQLVAESPISNFAQKKHLFVQAMLRVEDLFSEQRNKAASLFSEDIKQYFDQESIFYSDDVQFMGQSGFAHNYDFLLQRSKNKPERLCQAINNPNKSAMGNVLFAWNDTKPARKSDSQLIVILNDNNNITQGVENGFNIYSAKVILWSERFTKENIALLSA